MAKVADRRQRRPTCRPEVDGFRRWVTIPHERHNLQLIKNAAQ